MSYVDSQLLPGEVVLHRARRSKALFTAPWIVVGLAVLAAVAALMGVPPYKIWLWRLALALLAIAAAWYVGCKIRYTSAEFAVTNKRVIIKTGWMRRRTLETMLSKIEGVGVDQGILGRMMNYGSITVTGTGGTKEVFDEIANPLEFRRQVQGAISAGEDARAGIAAPARG